MASFAAQFQEYIYAQGQVDLRSQKARRDWRVKRYVAEWDVNRTVYRMVEVEFDDGSAWGIELGVSEPGEQHYTWVPPVEMVPTKMKVASLSSDESDGGYYVRR